jgi:uncharacterized membrane protein
MATLPTQDASPPPPSRPDGLVTLTHVMYGLHAFSALTGLVSAAFVVTAFLTGWPSIIAIIINYVKRGDVRGSWLDSHFRWQLRTFWFALLWMIISGLVAATLIGIPIALAFILAVGIWVVYRIGRGWLTLLDGKPMPVD